MCSILAMFELADDPVSLRPRALDLSRKMRHRGPDWSGVETRDGAILAHERLSIVDVTHGAQPLVSRDETLILAVNGEIYNHRRLRDRLAQPYAFRTESDCEVILPLYAERGVEFLNDLNGIFAFALYDDARERYLIARDPIGVIPLFTGRDDRGQLYVASEMKALIGVCRSIEDFPPGHFVSGRDRRAGRASRERYYAAHLAGLRGTVRRTPLSIYSRAPDRLWKRCGGRGS